MVRRRATPLSGVPISNGDGSVTREVSCRAIENGFVVRESTYGDGEYTSRERFSKTAPTLPRMTGQLSGSVGDERLSGAIKECKD